MVTRGAEAANEVKISTPVALTARLKVGELLDIVLESESCVTTGDQIPQILRIRRAMQTASLQWYAASDPRSSRVTPPGSEHDYAALSCVCPGSFKNMRGWPLTSPPPTGNSLPVPHGYAVVYFWPTLTIAASSLEVAAFHACYYVRCNGELLVLMFFRSTHNKMSLEAQQLFLLI